MGSGSSKGRKVPSELLDAGERKEKQRTQASDVFNLKEETGYAAYTIQQLTSFSMKPRDAASHSDGSESEFSMDEEDIERELERVLAESAGSGLCPGGKCRKNSFTRSNTYSFCNARLQVCKGADFSSTPYIQRARGLDLRRMQPLPNVRLRSEMVQARKKGTDPPVAAWQNPQNRTTSFYKNRCIPQNSKPVFKPQRAPACSSYSCLL
nr:PREDICTED: uncharacterized protein LOC106703999 isoform X2 [Latimeria chalumnae]|eukprot:XP_014345534.1 PREDICTED: uncharacterized protein LOC106703999 isoform X2 [Latimeria chalumnae]